MNWPAIIDYNQAIQNLSTAVADEELRQGELTRDGRLPVKWVGRAGVVYQVACPQTGNTWAVKCFTSEVGDRQSRYRAIAAHLEQVALPFTVDFQYVEEGIRVAGVWYPVVKMRWVEGLTLNQFVEEHVDRPQNLRRLLDLWVRLSVRLREAGMAHADLQHGNVLLVPHERGQLALRLIDYDGMYVPALAGTASGEVGHPAYQHPQRLREGTYNAEVDRFSHLAIYTAVHCVSVGGRQLWQKYDNGDNLLFGEADFRSPGESEVFRTLWQLRDGAARALVGRLALACGKPLEEAPLLDEVVRGGKAVPQKRAEKAEVNRLLTPAAPRPEPLGPEPGTEPGRTPAHVWGRWLSYPPVRRAVSVSSLALQRFDRLLAALAGQGNTFIHNLLRGTAALGLLLLVFLAARMLRPDQGLPLIISPVGLRSIEAGKTLTVAVAVENVGAWQEGELRYRLDSTSTPGARIDPTTGQFTWLPPLGQVPGTYDVAVSVESADGRNASTVFRVEVTRPLRLPPIASQSIEAGRTLAVAVGVHNANAWPGALRYCLDSTSTPGAQIDPATGDFTWTPPAGRSPATYHVTVSVEAGDRQKDRATFRIEVAPSKEIAIDLGRGLKLEMVLVSAGEFVMGSGEPAESLANAFRQFGASRADDFKKEYPQHRVRITKPFYLGKYEVTRRQFRRFVDDSGYKTDAEKDGKGGQGVDPATGKLGQKPEYTWRSCSFEQTDEHPVVNVSWNDAVEFCKWLSARDGKTYRLPTEAEWEYGCRAGTTTRYYCGDDPEGLAKVGNVADASAKAKFPDWIAISARDGYVFTSPVGKFEPNAFGLYDMHGNVWEWCADWYDSGYYANSPADDPTGPTTGAERVVRGGGSGHAARYCRSANRGSNLPRFRNGDLGLRPCLVLANETPPPRTLRLLAIAPQTAEAGKALSVAVPVENAAAWQGKLRYSLGSQTTPGARIDAVTGDFTWTPPAGQSPGPCDVTVFVEATDGQKARTSFRIQVTATRVKLPDSPTPPVGAVDLGKGVKLEMVLIPAGDFLMGSSDSDQEARSDERPLHRVRITKPFYLGKYEVTQEQWEAAGHSSCH